MRIISPFTDYYDSAGGYDEEPTPVYLREPVVSEVRGRLAWSGPTSWTSPDPSVLPVMRHLDSALVGAQLDGPDLADADLLAVGFCGMIGLGWRWRGQVFWDGLELARAAGERASHVLRGARIHWPPSASERASTLPLFRGLDAPAFLVELTPTAQLTRNPRLSSLGLQSIVDPYSARQAVETYLGNELAKQVDPPQPISDEDMRDMKGFDDRSFKAAPGGPGRKRRKGS